MVTRVEFHTAQIFKIGTEARTRRDNASHLQRHVINMTFFLSSVTTVSSSDCSLVWSPGLTQKSISSPEMSLRRMSGSNLKMLDDVLTHLHVVFVIIISAVWASLLRRLSAYPNIRRYFLKRCPCDLSNSQLMLAIHCLPYPPNIDSSPARLKLPPPPLLVPPFTVSQSFLNLVTLKNTCARYVISIRSLKHFECL